MLFKKEIENMFKTKQKEQKKNISEELSSINESVLQIYTELEEYTERQKAFKSNIISEVS